jgi:ribosomal protein S27AE
MDHFVNHGDGWTCRRCHTEETPTPRAPLSGTRGRFFSEGEAEEREPKLSTPARARWRDRTRRALLCPQCGIEEKVAT